MLFWHVGGSIWLFRYLFRDPGVDLRFVAVGAILSDLIDKPVGRVLWADTFQTGRIYGHTLLFFVLLLTAVMLITTRGTPQRRRWVALAVGVMFHLILDAMWMIPETLFWPFFGLDFPASIDDYWSGFFGRLLSNPRVIVQEVVGALYLGYLWRSAGLSDSLRRKELLQGGTIRTQRSS